MAGWKESDRQAIADRHPGLEWDRYQGRHQAFDRHIVKQGQLAFFIQARLHDAARVLMEDADQRQGGRSGINRHVGEALDDQFQRTGMIRVGMRDQDRIQLARRAFDLAQIGKLVGSQPEVRFGGWTDAAVDQHALPAGFHQRSACPNLIRATQEGNFHDL